MLVRMPGKDGDSGELRQVNILHSGERQSSSEIFSHSLLIQIEMTSISLNTTLFSDPVSTLFSFSPLTHPSSRLLNCLVILFDELSTKVLKVKSAYLVCSRTNLGAVLQVDK
jgi:hypothetical protein